ncbi:GtrA family protein [Guptibacillus hwajinpoensis]|uniref:Flippase GtrA n=1 Tax=Guptibacillus hwajinpoensis TaxID=208199 RepID=A0ABU0K570_9BACL|nr:MULTISPECIES: GtrA family protein [Alkalihalobacillus]MDP4549311.1 GtrA family protein [Alkalihalobacillus macyae]MDQ0484507.1 putative flippase GtrA [Alkalihalobacillus hemicentroti]
MKQSGIGKGSKQVMSFSAIGVMNALVDIGALNLLMLFFPTDDRIQLIVYNTIAYTLAITNSYFWNAKLTFPSKAIHDRKQVLLFLAQAIIALGISNLVFYGALLIFEWITFPRYIERNISKGLAMLLSSASSFFMMKHLVFPRTKQKQNSN